MDIVAEAGEASEPESSVLPREAAAIEKIREHIKSGDSGMWVISKDDLPDDGDRGYNQEALGPVLHEFGSVIKDAPNYEVGVVLDKNGRFVFARRGYEDNIPINEGELKDCIFIHNHPKGTPAFSLSDVGVLVDEEAYGGSLVTPNGEFVSLMRNKDNPGRILYRGMRSVIGANDEIVGDAKVTLLNNGVNNPTENEIRQEIGRIVNNWLSKNAEERGYRFNKEVI